MTTCLGDETVTQHCRVLDTDAFDIVISTDFSRRNPQVKMLSLQRPYSMHCNYASWLCSVPLELLGRKESGLRYASKTNYRTETYQLARHVLENGVAALHGNLDEIQVELFASQQQHFMQFPIIYTPGSAAWDTSNSFAEGKMVWRGSGQCYRHDTCHLAVKDKGRPLGWRTAWDGVGRCVAVAYIFSSAHGSAKRNWLARP